MPPSVVVKAQFPGANPKVIAETVASPLEEQINGIENMLYMFSQATSDGTLTLTVTFKLGTDPESGAAVGAEPREPGAAAPARRTCAARRHHGQELARPDDGGASVLAERPLRHALSPQLRRAQRQGSAGADPRHRQTCSCSARATTRCASGSIRDKVAERGLTAERRGRTRSASKTCRWRPA